MVPEVDGMEHHVGRGWMNLANDSQHLVEGWILFLVKTDQGASYNYRLYLKASSIPECTELIAHVCGDHGVLQVPL